MLINQTANQSKFPRNLDRAWRARIESKSSDILRPGNPEVLIQLEYGSHYSGRVMKCELERGDEEETATTRRDEDEDDVGNIDAEDVPRREAERYNHKPVIDLLVLKSQAPEQ